MEEYIYLVIQQIGDFKTILKAYKSYGDASTESKRLLKESHDQGYTDFKYPIKTMELN